MKMILPAVAVILSFLPRAQAMQPRIAIEPVPVFETDPPPAAIADLVAGNPTETTLALQWTAPLDTTSPSGIRTDGSALAYDLRYSLVDPATVDASWWSAATPTIADDDMKPKLPGNAETLVVSGLTPGLTHYFAIKSRDGVSTDHWSALSNIAMGATAPPYIPPAQQPTSGYGESTPRSGNGCGYSAAGHASIAFLVAAGILVLQRGNRA